MYNQTPIEQVVMRRVHTIRILALIISTTTLAGLTLLAALWGIGKEVWVARVFENMPPLHELGAFLAFWVSAFLATSLIVQVLALLTLLSFVFLCREVARMLVTQSQASL